MFISSNNISRSFLSHEVLPNKNQFMITIHRIFFHSQYKIKTHAHTNKTYMSLYENIYDNKMLSEFSIDEWQEKSWSH